MTLKSAVNRFRIRPFGTVSSHRKGARRTLELTFSNMFRDALIEAAYAHAYLAVPIMIAVAEGAE